MPDWTFQPSENRRCTVCGSRMLLVRSNLFSEGGDTTFFYNWECHKPSHGVLKVSAGSYRPTGEKTNFEKWAELNKLDGGK